MSIAKTAASHIQQITEKYFFVIILFIFLFFFFVYRHNLEIRLIEEKQQEECRLYQLQISQLRHELEESNVKIKRQNDKHVHIERQLHKFMESLRQDHVTTLDEINSFRSKSFTNLEELLSFEIPEEERGRKFDLGETPVSSREKANRKKETAIQDTIQMVKFVFDWLSDLIT